MTIEDARGLKVALTDQQNARNTLIAAANDQEIEHAADRYLEATDRCYDMAVRIKNREAIG